MSAPVPIIQKHPEGAFCWVELGTPDTAGAKQFYTDLFGWDVEEVPMGPSETYTMFRTQGLQHAAMYRLQPEHLAQGVPPHWAVYIATDNADASAAKARELGATILAGPFDVRSSGRMAILKDPHGATFAVWQANEHIGARIAGVPGTLCWTELVTPDAKGSKQFYTSLFPWSTKVGASAVPDSQIEYTEWQLAGQSIGGMMEMKDLPPHWMPYFLVSNCAESVQLAQELKAHVQFGPMPIAGVGDFAVLRDPQGAHFTAISLSAAA
ncbi:MAG: VOC family protein [Bryobacteraceae bacterium]|nr:VOC family protein [Bryobacteraceae bacterium]